MNNRIFNYKTGCKNHPNSKKVYKTRAWFCVSCLEEKRLKLQNEFIEKSKKIHKEKYNYSKVKYEKNYEKIIIICPKHGSFLQEPSNHVRGQGCDSCLNESLRLTTQQVIDKFVKVHRNIYDYSKVEYLQNKIPVLIICKKHGEFKQLSNKHLLGQGCPKCRMSHGERKIYNFLVDNDFVFKHQKNFPDFFNKKTKQRYKFDFYLSEYNLCIEYDGEQHYKPRCIGGISQIEANSNFKIIKKYDKIKNNYCKKNNIKLIRVNYKSLKTLESKLKKELCKKIPQVQLVLQKSNKNL